MNGMLACATRPSGSDAYANSRYLPGAGARTTGTIAAGYGLVVAASTVTALVFLALGETIASGRLAKRRGLRLHERPWMASAAMLARKYELPVIPIHIRARNSALFYFMDMLHPTLRDITLFHETLNKDRQPFRMIVGEPISPRALPDRAEDGIALLREAVQSLPAERAPRLGFDLWRGKVVLGR